VTRSAGWLRAAVVTAALLLAVAGTVGGPVGSATAANKSRPIATAPFTAPNDVALADTPPPWALPANARPYVEAAGLTVLCEEQLAVHYHAHLDVIANGKPVSVPPGIGFVIVNSRATALTELHTHDASGIVHIESAQDKPYSLGQVFTEWGVALNGRQHERAPRVRQRSPFPGRPRRHRAEAAPGDRALVRTGEREAEGSEVLPLPSRPLRMWSVISIDVGGRRG
jgi:hypothetical protein